MCVKMKKKRVENANKKLWNWHINMRTLNSFHFHFFNVFAVDLFIIQIH